MLQKEQQKQLLCCQIEFNKLSDQTKAILFGLILGDGSLKIHKGYEHARLAFRHSITQKDYFEWKRDRLNNELSASQEFSGLEYGKQKLRYLSGAKPCLTYLHYITHKGGEIKINRNWLNLMTPLSLAIWWCDDGSLTSQGIFGTDGFSEENVIVLDKYMKKTWNITTTILDTTKDRYKLAIKTHEDLKRFLILIMHHIPTLSMLKKVLLLYHDADLQQRWISEMVFHTKYSREIIENIWKAEQRMI